MPESYLGLGVVVEHWHVVRRDTGDRERRCSSALGSGSSTVTGFDSRGASSKASKARQDQWDASALEPSGLQILQAGLFGGQAGQCSSGARSTMDTIKECIHAALNLLKLSGFVGKHGVEAISEK